jgi:hypothetical protein
MRPHITLTKVPLLTIPFDGSAGEPSRMLWLIVWRRRCLTVHTTEERALAMILFAYQQGAEIVPLA